MVLLVVVGVQALETLPRLIALRAEEEVVAVLAHPAVLHHHLLAIETFVDSLFVEPRLKDHLELMIASVVLRRPMPIMPGSVEEALLAFVIDLLHKL